MAQNNPKSPAKVARYLRATQGTGGDKNFGQSVRRVAQALHGGNSMGDQGSDGTEHGVGMNTPFTPPGLAMGRGPSNLPKDEHD